MKEDNQKLVEKEIYEVYKFMDVEDQLEETKPGANREQQKEYLKKTSKELEQRHHQKTKQVTQLEKEKK